MLSNIKTNRLLWALGVCAWVIHRNHRLWCWGMLQNGNVRHLEAWWRRMPRTTSYIFPPVIFLWTCMRRAFPAEFNVFLSRTCRVYMPKVYKPSIPV